MQSSLVRRRVVLFGIQLSRSRRLGNYLCLISACCCVVLLTCTYQLPI
ncbi:MAG: hypothetical protein ACKERG_02445 [Candidatus Hodgkinia cicadicola]